MDGCNIRIFEDGFAYVDYDEGERIMVDLPERKNESVFYTLDKLDSEKNILNTVEADDEEELFKYMFDMIYLILGPGIYYYDLNKITYIDDDKMSWKSENILCYVSSPTFSKEDHAEHFRPEKEEYNSDEEEEELNYYEE